MKKCSRCNEFKPLEEFGVRKNSKDGRKEACKKCLNDIQKEYYRSEKGQKRAREYESSDRRKELRNTPEAKKKKLEYNMQPHRKLKRKEHSKLPEIKKRRLEWCSQWRKKNRGKRNADWIEYQTRKMNAMPKWLTKEERDFIISLYKHAKYIEKMFGIKCHVDHIIPLRGENVCGLHVPWNLQILTAEDNLKKGNRL